MDVFGKETTSAPEQRLDLGVAHGDEIFTLFNQKGYGLAPHDAPMVKKMVGLWTAFAKSGKPATDEKWAPVAKDGVKYAVLDDEEVRTERSDEFAERMTFFNSMTSLVESYRAFDIDSHPAIREMLKLREAEEASAADLGMHDEL